MTLYTLHLNIMNNPNIVHKKLYKLIYQQRDPHNIPTIPRQFPYLPTTLIIKALKCHEPITKYLQLVSYTNTQLYQIQNSHFT